MYQSCYYDLGLGNKNKTNGGIRDIRDFDVVIVNA